MTRTNKIYIVAAIALMALISIAFFYPDAMDGKVLSQHDIRQGLANGHEGQVFTEETGETTRWTNSLFSGMPNFQIAPSYSSTPMLHWITQAYGLWLPSPSNLLFAMMLGFFIMGMCMEMKWYVSLFGAVAWAFSSYFIIIIGAGHIWKFVTLTYIPPTLGGIWLCYRGKYLWGTALAALFGALQLMANHIQMSYYFAFVVLALMGATFMGLRKQGKLKQWFVATGCLVGAALLAIGANFASLYNTAQYSKETVRGKATYLTSEEGAKSAGGGADFDYITQWSYGGDETLTLLVPNAKGGATLKPVAGNNMPLSVMDLKGSETKGLDYEQTEMTRANFNQYFGNQPMTNGPVYVGAFVLVLAVLGVCLSRGPLRWWLLGVTLLSVLLSWGHNFEWLSRLFVDYFPGYNRFRTVASILVIAEFTIPLLAMMGLARIIKICSGEEPADKSLSMEAVKAKLAKQVLTVGGCLGLLCVLLWLFPGLMGSGLSVNEMDALREQDLFKDPYFIPIIQAVKELRLEMVSADALRSLLFVALGTGLVWAYVKGVYKSVYVMAGAVLLVCLVDLYTVDKRYVDTENFTEAQEAEFEPNAADIEILKDKDPNFRVFDTYGFGDARSSYFHKTIGGYHAAKLTRYNDLIEKQITKGNQGVLNMLNAKYIIGVATNEQGQPMADELGNPMWIAQLNPDALGNAWWVSSVRYVNDDNAEMSALDNLDVATSAVANKEYAKQLGQASVPDSTDFIKEVSYAPNKLTYKSKSGKGGVAVFSEVYFPWGWTATIDGKEVPIARVNYVLRALKVPAGEHDIVFTFNPQSLRVTDGISVAAVVCIYLLLACGVVVAVLAFMKQKKHEALPRAKDVEKTS